MKDRLFWRGFWLGTKAAAGIIFALATLLLLCLSGCKMTFKTLPCECAQRDMQ